jgi:hypothetical protein
MWGYMKSLEGIRNRLRGWLRPIPLFGGLADCRWQDHWETMRHLSVILGLSTTPIWLAAILIYATENQTGSLMFREALYKTVSKGQLCMYCTSFLAPLLWVALVDPKGARIFPSRLSHMFLVVIVDIMAAGLFAYTVTNKVFNEKFTFQISIYMVSVSILLRYLGMVYHASRMPNAPAEFRKQQEDFSSLLREHRQ